jgi:hypothetical protein
MLTLLVTIAAGLGGYLLARNFVRHRLRFVDAIHTPWAPLVAGGLAFLLAWPMTLLPLVSVAPALWFGIGIGLGTATGARLVRRSENTRQLRP